MNGILCRRNFYALMLKDRSAVARARLVRAECGREDMGELEFFVSPLGLLVLARTKNGVRIGKISLKGRGKAAANSLFCGDNAVELSEGVSLSVSTELRIDDVLSCELSVALDGEKISARAEMKKSREMAI